MAKILVIDDDRDLRHVVARALRMAGHETREAEDGRIGVQMAKRDLPELVVTDIMMPNQEGISTIVELRALSPSLAIVGVSGSPAPRFRGLAPD